MATVSPERFEELVQATRALYHAIASLAGTVDALTLAQGERSVIDDRALASVFTNLKEAWSHLPL